MIFPLLFPLSLALIISFLSIARDPSHMLMDIDLTHLLHKDRICWHSGSWEMKSLTCREWYTICQMILTFSYQSLASFLCFAKDLVSKQLTYVLNMISFSPSNFCIGATKLQIWVHFHKWWRDRLEPSITTILNYSYKELVLMFSELNEQVTAKFW